MQDLHGAFSCICLVKGVGLVAFRDPNGIRPLVLGTRLTPDGPEWCIASEDCAFGPIGFKRVRDVQPGEMIIVTEDGDVVCSQCREQQLRPCIFEYIYLARPDSVLNDISVYASQPCSLCFPWVVTPVAAGPTSCAVVRSGQSTRTRGMQRCGVRSTEEGQAFCTARFQSQGYPNARVACWNTQVATKSMTSDCAVVMMFGNG